MGIAEYALVDPDFYLPIERHQAGEQYVATGQPPTWQRLDHGIWTSWQPPAVVLPEQGWKVHVSARLERARPVLETVSAICGAHGVTFKHLRSEWQFLWMHHKHGPRRQSGKFCAAYPADPVAARALMTDLAAALAGETGPYVLTDRRFGDSRVVSYRYGAFLPRWRVHPDGTRYSVLTAPGGAEVADLREPQFRLPAGIVDPFAAVQPPRAAGPVSLRGYTVNAVLQYSNAGGAYRATGPDGRSVFIKEARGDNGYQWDRSTAIKRLRRERDTLRVLHAVAPGVCPEPLDYFGEWEHEFLVTEFVPGRTVWSWVSSRNPHSGGDRSPGAKAGYHDRCRILLDALSADLDRLHAAGYAFIDVNPHNVLVDDDDRPRLIDFEEAQRADEPARGHGAEGYMPRRASAAAGEPSLDPIQRDEYGLAAIAQLLIFPLHTVLDRNPAAVAHLNADTPEVPGDLRRRAVRLQPQPRSSVLPSPEEVAEAPTHWMRWLRDRVVAGLEAQADPDAAMPYPTIPQGYLTNPFNVAYGVAGVVHALHRAGPGAPAPILHALVDGAMRDRADLPPGLLTGTAGIAWVLSDLGHIDAARELLDAADRHPALGLDATLGHGSAGVALAHLALHRHDEDPRHLARAGDLARTLTDDAFLDSGLGPDRTTGWRLGRAGVALALHYVAEAIDSADLTAYGRGLLMAELAATHDDGDGGMLFRVSDRDRRVEPYLACGSAGFALVTGRYLTSAPAGADDPLAGPYRRALTAVRATLLPLLPALLEGLAGLGLVQSDLGVLTGDESLRAAATRSACALFKYTVPRDGGICFLGGGGNRISADLGYGAAGVLLFLDQLLTGRPDSLFTLDAPTATVASSTSRVLLGAS